MNTNSEKTNCQEYKAPRLVVVSFNASTQILGYSSSVDPINEDVG